MRKSTFFGFIGVFGFGFGSGVVVANNVDSFDFASSLSGVEAEVVVGASDVLNPVAVRLAASVDVDVRDVDWATRVHDGRVEVMVQRVDVLGECPVEGVVLAGRGDVSEVQELA